MKRTIIIGLIAGIVLLLGAVLLLMNNSAPVAEENMTTADENSVVSENEPTGEEQVTNEITLTEEGFSPSELTITAGEKVIWRNLSVAPASVDSEPHPMHNAYPSLNLGLFQNNETLEFVFSDPGTYQFHNHLKPENKGTIIVQ